MKNILIILILSSFVLLGLDNPDSPDYVADFEKRIKPFENYISEKASTTLDFIQGYKKLETELDKELNSAYKLIQSKLNGNNKELLKKSQIQWIKFRDAEFLWLSTNFTKEKFGSSVYITIGSFRTQIIKDRVKELLWYTKQY